MSGDGDEMPVKPRTDGQNILIIGTGVAGVKCAFALAELGYHVYLQDKRPYLGGKISQLYKQFPTNDCGWCKMLPQYYSSGSCIETCLRRNIWHKNITLLPYSTVTSVSEGKHKQYEVKLHRKTRFLHEDKCIGCGLCVAECPVDVADEYNSGQSTRKAIWMRSGGPVPRIVTIDIDKCTKCGKCATVCPTKAIDLGLKDRDETLTVSAVVLATGYEEALPETSEYGWGRFPNVLTNMELERQISGDGPGSIDLEGKRIGIIQCVGSRTEKNDYCSSACCMYALKEAIMLKKSYPGAEITIYYMDMRTFGKEYFRYQKEAEKLGIGLVPCRVPAVDAGEGGKVSLKWTDEQEIKSEEFDYVVLSIGQKVSEEARKLVSALGLKHDNYGFVYTGALNPVQTSKPGIYACGSATGPKDIPDSVTEALAVAGQISSDIPLKKPVAEEKLEIREETEPKIALFLCVCGVTKDSKIESAFDAVIERAMERNDVVVAEEIEILCQPSGIAKMKELIVKNKATRVLVAACAPYQYQPEFEKAVREAGVDTQLLEITDIRELGFWSSPNGGKRVQRQVMASLAKLALKDKIEGKPIPVAQRALVIGGGLAGLNAAVLLAKHSINVDIVEKSPDIGGNLSNVTRLIDGTVLREHTKDLLHSIKNLPGVKLYCDSHIESVSGQCGNFHARIKGKDGEQTGHYGAIIIATGGAEYYPMEYGFGKDKRIMTQSAFEKSLDAHSHPKSVVMIQCVGSRDELHSYCSRICCQVAIKNALELKKHHNDSEVYILHRDIMTYGLSEKHYTDARKAGIVFVRFSKEEPPKVDISSGPLKVTVKDRVMGREFELKPDALVLSAGIVPSPDTGVIRSLNLATDPDGFILEANTKFRPVDTLTDGVFICGLAHSPRLVGEAIAQSNAAAVQALSLLSGTPGARPIVSKVKKRFCAGCEMCIEACPYHARYMNTDEKVAVVIEALCRGCGVCAVVCPSESARLKGQMRKAMMDAVDEMLE